MSRKRAYMCFLCGSKFPSARTYNHHFKNRHDCLTCKDCDRDFNNPLSLKKHSYTHRELDHKCRHYKRLFPFKSQMLLHEATQEPDKCFHCTRKGCTRSYTRASDLKLHIKLSDSESTAFNCTHCDYITNDIRNLRQHERVHLEVHPYRCSNCNKSFRFSMQRKHHQCDWHFNVYVTICGKKIIHSNKLECIAL